MLQSHFILIKLPLTDPVFFPFREHPVFSLLTYRNYLQASLSLVFPWHALFHIKHITALTATCFWTLIITLSTAAHHRGEMTELSCFIQNQGFNPLLRCPIISMLSIYFIFLSLSLSLSLCVWCDVSLFLCQKWSLEFRDGECIRGSRLITDGG